MNDLTIAHTGTWALARIMIVIALAQPNSPDCPMRAVQDGLRVAEITEGAVSLFKMADQSRHKSLDMLREYVRDEELFDDHSAARLL